MNAQDIKNHFATNGGNVAFVFEDSLLARQELATADLGPDVEILEYKGDAFAAKCRIRALAPVDAAAKVADLVEKSAE